MNITETVALPPVEEQPLVHPLDLPEARDDFRRAYWTRSLTSPGVALVIAALSWFVVENWVVPVVVLLTLAVIGYFAAAWSDREAWGFIPRKRRDLGRELPWAWQLISAIILAALLSVGILLLGARFASYPSEVREYVIGSGVAITAVCIVALVVRLARPKERRAALFSIAPIVALVASLAIVWAWTFGSGFVQWTTMALGAGITLVVAGFGGLGMLFERRRQRRLAASA